MRNAGLGQFEASDRLRCVLVTPIVLAEMVKIGWRLPGKLDQAIECLDGVPSDAELVRAGYEPTCDSFFLIFQHASFEKIDAGDAIPEQKTLMRRVPVGV